MAFCLRSLFAATASLAVLVPATALAQGGPDSSGYLWNFGTYDWVTLDPGLGGPGADIGISGSSWEIDVTLPWAFPFYGNTYTDVTVSEEGGLVMGTGGDLFTTNGSFPDTSSSSPDIAIFWDSLDGWNSSAGAPNGNVFTYYDTANDRFIISYEGISEGGDSNDLFFQAHLHGDGNISFHYQDTESSSPTDSNSYGGSATVGIQDFTGGTADNGNALEVSYNTPFIQDGITAIYFTQCVDVDADGFFDVACGGSDCDDANALINPGVTDVCSDGIDQDCNGYDQVSDQDLDGSLNLACGGDDCDDLDPNVNPNIDADGDGADSCVDCDDNAAAAVPGGTSPEICDGLDNDCDGLFAAGVIIGDNANGTFSSSSGRARGMWWDITANVALARFGADLGVPVGEQVTFVIYGAPQGMQVQNLFQTNYISADGADAVRWVDVGLELQAGWRYLFAYVFDSNSGSINYNYNTGGSSNYPVTPFGEQTDGYAQSISSPQAEPTHTTSTYYSTVLEFTAADFELVDNDGDGTTLCLGDCNDADPNIFPTAVEVCDGVDNNCDTNVDDIDVDLDGEAPLECGGTDCDDTNNTINTAAVEICDGVDQNCDGVDDVNDPSIGTVVDAPVSMSATPGLVFGQDNDPNAPLIVTSDITMTGFTNPIVDVNVTVDISHEYDADVDITLTSPAGTTVLLVAGEGGSGNDFTATIFDDQAATSITSGSPPFTGSFSPEGSLGDFNAETADGVWTLTVEDTFASLDDGVFNSWSLEITTGVSSDADNDGWVGSTFCTGGDCDDTDATIFPGAPEVCADSIDQDCDGLDIASADIDLDTYDSVECGGTDCDDNNANVFDGSDFDTDLALGCQDDCDDTDATVNPSGVEVCNDGIDQDCDGEDLTGTVDGDGDGETTCTDCDDTDPLVNAAATEVCADGIDNDCSGIVDDLDADADGSVTTECGGADCDDADATVNPNATELCDGIDGDCDGIADGQETDFQPAPSGSVQGTNAPAAPITADVNNGGPLTVDTITIATGTADVITDVNLTIDISHTWDDDLDIYLVSPDGVSVEIVTDIGSSGDDFTNTVFDDQATTPIPDTSSEAPFTGTYQPEGLLADFNGGTVDGVWTLEITDDAGGDDGTLNSWTIDIVYGPVSDLDGDGWIGPSFCSFGDCDDDPTVNPDAATINPGATEICGDAIDQDCDGSDLVADVDLDGDSSVECGGGDCDDADALVSSLAAEVCGDTIDNDCDAGTPDIVDADMDGSDCTLDCDDNNALAWPGFFEICNDGADNDCDPITVDLGDQDNDGDLCDVDCDDTNPLFGPSQVELLCSGYDEDCDAGASTPDIDDGDLDGFNCDVECLDTNPAVNPAAVEVNCDGLDNDCDPSTEGEVDLDGDGSTCGFDCDDNQPLAYPGFVEACNDGIDNDCDPTTVDAFDLDLDGVTCITDCDDDDPLSFPGAPEICGDGIDQDCDQTVDEPANDAYALTDDDSVLIGLCGWSFPFCGSDWDEVYVGSNGRVTFGFTNPEHTEGVAAFLAQTPEIAAFWNDLNPAAGGSIEVEEQANALVVTYTDVPELGVSGSANSATLTLYDDGTASIAYGDLSMPDGLVGFSCGTAGDIVEVDLSEYELLPNAWAIGTGTESALYELFSGPNPNDVENTTIDLCLTGGDDNDGDGWTDLCGDCDDTAVDVFPGSPDVCGDGIDQDCDGTADNADLDGDGEVDTACGGVDCDDTDELVNTGATEVCNGIDDDCDGSPETGGEDSDADGFLICDGDCDDSDANINPDAAEVCDQVDNDCDGALDNGFTPDFDNDGQVSDQCGGDDCDDTDNNVFLGADEICDLQDNDCNGEIDEIDDDEDGYIDGNCNGDDCNDDDPNVNPGATEVAYDGIDNDCSGGDVVDADGDGFFGGEDGNDCDDNDADINPNAEEICDDSIDNNCDGGVDKGDRDNDIPADAFCSACNCSSSVVDADAPAGSAMLLLGLAGLLGLRRRRN